VGEILSSDILLYIFSKLKWVLGEILHNDPKKTSENSQNLIQLSSRWPVIQKAA
jgi:hypothetical protein